MRNATGPEATVHEEYLSDGSEVYSVHWWVDTHLVIIDAYDEAHANRIAKTLEDVAMTRIECL